SRLKSATAYYCNSNRWSICIRDGTSPHIMLPIMPCPGFDLAAIDGLLIGDRSTCALVSSVPAVQLLSAKPSHRVTSMKGHVTAITDQKTRGPHTMAVGCCRSILAHIVRPAAPCTTTLARH